ncbi:MAG: ABC transporter ATP-binding protein [Liquorilactobacillus nagelii]|uniref:ABC transporter ATP-binding protein n=1 Tax=Liquorilactobacillus nagelii TaxID=82688 RepID=UPI0039EA05CE
MTTKKLLEMQQINKSFGNGLSKVHVLHNLNFAAEAGQLSLILGPSGSGKSTFLTIAGGLQSPSSGQVKLAGQVLIELSAKQRDSLRLNQIGFVLQSYNLLPYLKVSDQFALVDRIKPANNLSPTELASLLDELGIAELIDKYPAELSGGQNQRVAIARALYPNPPIILADEPTAALDSQRVEQVGQLFADLAHTEQKAVIIVTHDLRLKRFADQINEIKDGQLLPTVINH